MYFQLGKKYGSENQEEYANINWDELGFQSISTDFMYIMKCSKEGSFDHGTLIPFGNIELSPYAGVLNFGQVRNSEYIVTINQYKNITSFKKKKRYKNIR